jgi:hypothetical protein
VSHGQNFLKPLQKADHFDSESGGALREAYGYILKNAVLPHIQVKTAVLIQALYKK